MSRYFFLAADYEITEVKTCLKAMNYINLYHRK